MSLFKMIFCT